MIDEDYVSFETAKLLKEKGFDDFNFTCHSYFYKNFGRPTLQMAMKWLRVKHNLHIITLPYAPMDRNPYHPGEADMVYIAQVFRGIIFIDEIGRKVSRLTNEEACEAAIKYCLENLI
jgi:hypothetical protein